MLNVKATTQNCKSDLRIRCYKFSIDVIKFLNTLPNERVYWIISDQLLRSATSIGANIVEAKSSSSRKDFLRFYQIALKSANETAYWLGLLKEATDQNPGKINILLDELKEISNMLAASVLTLKNKR